MVSWLPRRPMGVSAVTSSHRQAGLFIPVAPCAESDIPDFKDSDVCVRLLEVPDCSNHRFVFSGLPRLNRAEVSLAVLVLILNPDVRRLVLLYDPAGAIAGIAKPCFLQCFIERPGSNSDRRQVAAHDFPCSHGRYKLHHVVLPQLLLSRRMLKIWSLSPKLRSCKFSMS